MNELYHYGVKGQKWGVRRYQYADGSLTLAGLKRYSDSGQLSTKNRVAHMMSTTVKDLINTTRTKVTGNSTSIHIWRREPLFLEFRRLKILKSLRSMRLIRNKIHQII